MDGGAPELWFIIATQYQIFLNYKTYIFTDLQHLKLIKEKVIKNRFLSEKRKRNVCSIWSFIVSSIFFISLIVLSLLALACIPIQLLKFLCYPQPWSSCLRWNLIVFGLGSFALVSIDLILISLKILASSLTFPVILSRNHGNLWRVFCVALQITFLCLL